MKAIHSRYCLAQSESLLAILRYNPAIVLTDLYGITKQLKQMENVSRFYSHCDLALGLPVFRRPAAVADPCPTIDFIGLPPEPTAEGWP